jgi:hypothetical protein
MDKWYYSWNGEKLGPVSLDELKRLVEEGTLEAGDLVWTKGMPEWLPAGKVPELPFPEEPPPLPDSQVLRQAIQGRWDEALPAGARWLWHHKAVLFFAAAILCFVAAIIFSNMRMPSHYVLSAMVAGYVFFGGLVILGIYSLCKMGAKSYRKGLLVQKWESTTGDGSWVQFSQDGGFVRHDGFGAKYTFDVLNDKIELRPMDESSPIHLKIVLLSEKELALNWDGKTLHFQKPKWWKRMFA